MNSSKAAFYLIVPPGFEKIAFAELSYWWPLLPGEKVEELPEIHRDKGGLEFVISLHKGLLLNELLKVPSRILVRVQSFHCTSFEKLSQTVSQIPWSDFWSTSPEVKMHVSSRGSALYTAKRIEKSFLEGWRDFWQQEGSHTEKSDRKKEGNSQNGPQGIFVRIVDDHVTVSLDSSGEHLHKRGKRTHIGVAPLRENLAAGLLWFFCDAGKFNGIQEVTLTDPMAGSGVFALEARQLLRTKEPRSYSYQDWKKNKDETSLSSLWQQETFRNYELCDVDEKMLQAITDNLPHEDQEVFRLRQGDVISSHWQKSGEEAEQQGQGHWVIVNPPYGERIKVKGPLLEYYQGLFMNIEKNWEPKRVGTILPRKVNLKKLRLPTSWRYRKSLFFKNGGIDVVFVYWDVSRQ